MPRTAANTPLDNNAKANPMAVHKNTFLAALTRFGSSPPPKSMTAPTRIITGTIRIAATKIQLPMFSKIAINSEALKVGTVAML